MLTVVPIHTILLPGGHSLFLRNTLRLEYT
jgi:hypothetical protein